MHSVPEYFIFHKYTDMKTKCIFFRLYKDIHDFDY